MKKLLFCLVCLHSVAWALPEDAQKPIHLSADTVSYSQSTNQATYTGNVVITQGTLKIVASTLMVNLNNDKSIASAQATGNLASFEQTVSADKGLAKGVAQKIDYNAKTGILSMTGNAKLTQDGTNFSGNSIRYSLKMGDVEATGGQGKRVELVIAPNPNAKFEAVRP